MHENVPLTIIWDAESDTAPKTALGVALGGPTDKTWEKCEIRKMTKSTFFDFCLP